MTVSELITELQKHDPEMEVQIQQRYEEFDYIMCQSVRKMDLIDGYAWMREEEDEESKIYVVIQYE